MKHPNNFFPGLAKYEVCPDGAIRLCPAKLLGYAEHGVLSFTYVCRVATCVLVNYSRIAHERDFVFVGKIKGDLCRLETDVELHFSIILEEL